MFKLLIQFRYLFIVAVVFILINAVAFLIIGIHNCIEGYRMAFETGLTTNAEIHPGLFFLEALDNFMTALIFMIFGLGIGRMFLFDAVPEEQMPGWLRIDDLKSLKVMLWEAILVFLVIYCLTHIARSDIYSLEVLILPGIILILSAALWLVKVK